MCIKLAIDDQEDFDLNCEPLDLDQMDEFEPWNLLESCSRRWYLFKVQFNFLVAVGFACAHPCALSWPFNEQEDFDFACEPLDLASMVDV